MDCDAFTDVELTIDTQGSRDSPTQLQLETLIQIRSLQPADLAGIDALVRQWASDVCEPDFLAELDEEDFTHEIEAIQIPPIRNAVNRYFILWLRCELEPEHGLGCAFRSGDGFAICHPETYDNVGWDVVTELDSPFDTGAH